MQMNIENEITRKVRSNMIAIKYDYVPKYCFIFMMQGHTKEDCRIRNIPKYNEENKEQMTRLGRKEFMNLFLLISFMSIDFKKVNLEYYLVDES